MILLPGICGSHLAVGGKRIWLGFRVINGLKRLAYPDAKDVTADGAIGPIYDDLAEHLRATHEVIEFSYDWRRPVEDEARRLAQVAEAALNIAVGQFDSGVEPFRILEFRPIQPQLRPLLERRKIVAREGIDVQLVLAQLLL